MAKRIPYAKHLESVACLLLAVCFIAGAGLELRAQSVLDTKPGAPAAEPHPEGWWPKEGSAARNAYTGPEACAPCHRAESAGWEATQMAHAITPAAESTFLLAHPHMAYKWGPYTYQINVAGNQAIYTVTDGEHSLSIPLLWAYGTGVVGQAFLFRIDQTYYEAEVAFYPVLDRLDVVAGLVRNAPPTLQQAFGLPLSSSAARQCIACHTTAAVTGNQLRVDSMILGVTCEACHGPGARHVAAMKALSNLSEGAKPAATFIFEPAKLAPTDLENFCGACHRTSLRVISEGLHGLDTVHYEPYRLEMSQCWIMSQQITCVTCHNPHQPLERNPAAYDADCLSCHSGKTGSSTAVVMGKTCPVATRNCVTCHMPKCRLPLSPFTMSDHFIRVVRPGDACAKS
ncbi:MAG: multiheme c-type cytochrome [Terriglobia bacterium]